MYKILANSVLSTLGDAGAEEATPLNRYCEDFGIFQLAFQISVLSDYYTIRQGMTDETACF
jgi:hypothetical protein